MDILCQEILCYALGRKKHEVSSPNAVVESGNEVEKIRVASKKIALCSACDYCSSHNGECAHKDDMAEVLQKMINADVIVLSSPVYFYSIDALLKAVIDRTVARWLEVKNKEFYYIVTMADGELSSADTTLACFRGYADCVELEIA